MKSEKVEEYDIMEVATPTAWAKNQELVLDFYNKRRKQVSEASPNAAHLALVELEKKYDVQIITQNIDDLHERAGSSKVLHLHGEIRKSRSTMDPSLIYEIDGWEIKKGDKCEKGSQLRPHIVWFGEMVPEMERAALLTMKADIFIVIGTSLNVYPAAGLCEYAPYDAEKYLVDPNELNVSFSFTTIKKTATEGIPELVNDLLSRS